MASGVHAEQRDIIRSVPIEIGGIAMKKNLCLIATLALAAALSPAAGKQVNVSGTVDKSTSVIRVTDIQPAS